MAIETEKQTLGFESEVKQLLDLVINSLYSNREIFLRELISNGSDAIDKLRFAALSDDALYEGDTDLTISVDFSEKLKTITVKDNGIGMTRDEAIANLGTIAKSGTKEFFGALSGDAKTDSHLIGQFGVGFYAAFIVSERVVVTSRRAGAGEDEGVRWESDGSGEFTVETIKRKKRGTEVVLHLKKDAKEFADNYRLRGIIKRYSDHIAMPITMPKTGEDAEGNETVNAATALWIRNKKDIKDDEYKSFYKTVSHDFEDPLIWIHNKVEGKYDYTTLFYIPARAPFDLWDREAKHGIKLYVQRVFIMDDAEQLLPRYLRFVRGIVDTNDLPLNISREILQRNKAIDTIRAASTKKIFALIKKLAKGEDYAKFWTAFGRALKEGVVEDPENKETIAKLLRFSSTHEDKDQESVSLADYLERMPENQSAIYYLVADSFATAKNSPHLEGFRSNNTEVLLMSDPIDEWLVNHLTEFEGKPLKSVTQGELDLPDNTDAEEEDSTNEEESSHVELVKRLKDSLGEQVKDVRTTKRLTTSPACLVTDEHDMSANLARILQASGQDVPASKRILEINPSHPLLIRVEQESDDERFGRFVQMLFEQAMLAEGAKLDDPAGFVQRMNELLLEIGS